MIYFPQLQTGASAQFPLERTIALRSASCEFTDGSIMRIADPGARVVRWKLTYKGLTDNEWGELESLFTQAQGQLNMFCFLDPFYNLLSWSADPTKPVWSVAPGIQITAGTEDAWGGTAGLVLTNSGAATQRISQILDIPGAYQYCWSVYFRDVDQASAKLIVETSDGRLWTDIPAFSGWNRAVMPVSIAGNAVSVGFGIDIPAGGSVHVCGMQVDAQPSPAKPRMTRGQSGVHPRCRFEQDELTLTSDGPNDHATTITLISQLSL